MKLRVERNLTILEACNQAGISEAWWHKAMMRPHVRQELENLTNAFIARVDGMKAFYKARAFELAAEMMENAKTDQERWKAVEFFTREAAKGGPSVTVNVESPAYAYVRPGERMVDVTPSDSNPEANDDAD